MRKVKNKIVKIFSSIGLALFTFGTKVKAVSWHQDLYGVFDPELEPKPTFWEKVLPIIKTVFLPLIFVIGLIVYWKKSKAEKKKKIYVTIASVILLALIYVVIYFIEKNQSL